jgi:hypothetical protein
MKLLGKLLCLHAAHSGYTDSKHNAASYNLTLDILTRPMGLANGRYT